MKTLELAFYLLASIVASVPLLVGARRQGGLLWVAAIAIPVSCVIAIATRAPVGRQGAKSVGHLVGQRVELLLPEFVKDEGFASSDACHSCHPGNYARSWQQSARHAAFLQ